jgi:hypothetical protein
MSHPSAEQLPGQARFDKMTGPAGERWWAAFRALEKINEQASVEAP